MPNLIYQILKSQQPDEQARLIYAEGVKAAIKADRCTPGKIQTELEKILKNELASYLRKHHLLSHRFAHMYNGVLYNAIFNWEPNGKDKKDQDQLVLIQLILLQQLKKQENGREFQLFNARSSWVNPKEKFKPPVLSRMKRNTLLGS